jgi:hypothetical protein
MQINPSVDNLRVAYIKRPGMVTRPKYGSGDFVERFRDANMNALNHKLIKESLDKLARGLTRKASTEEAWRTIFRKPGSKSWAETRMAMKVNANGYFNPCWSALAKFCEVLKSFGMRYSNMTIYDAGGASDQDVLPKYGFFRDRGDLPPVNLEGLNMSTYSTEDPEGRIVKSLTVVRDADILINASIHKGHDRFTQFSGVTMALKNHVGTISREDNNEFRHFGVDTVPGVIRLCGYSKMATILGNPSATVPVKQQLCFVDSTFVGQPGDWKGEVRDGDVLNTLVMGTFAGATDYLITKKLRPFADGTYPGYNDFNVPRVDEFLTAFNYSKGDLEALDAMNPRTDPRGRGWANADI